MGAKIDALVYEMLGTLLHFIYKYKGVKNMKKCLFCKKDLDDDFIFCPYCGKNQIKKDRPTKKRGNGQGTVYKRNNGNYTTQVTLGYYLVDGKLKRKTAQKSGFKTKRDALAYIETLRAGTTQHKNFTISQLWDIFQNGEMLELSKSKKCAYRIAYKKIASDTAYRTIDSFSALELQDISDGCGTSYYTCRDIKSLLSHFYKIAMRDDVVDKNKAQFIKLPPKNTSERPIFTDDQINDIWTRYNETADVTACRMLIMLYTGIRPGELLTIQADNINMTEQFMVGGIKTDKGKQRKIIIPNKILPLIKYSIECSRRGLLAWYNKSEDFYNSWRDLRGSLGMPDELTPYCCRHTYITRLTALKVSPAMLQELAGHEDYETTLDYTHLSIKERLREVNKL